MPTASDVRRFARLAGDWLDEPDETKLASRVSYLAGILDALADGSSSLPAASRALQDRATQRQES
jgi:hypothetical protein